MKALFEFLKKNELEPPLHMLMGHIMSWDIVRLRDFIAECSELIPHNTQNASSIFHFIANTSLSGGIRPCCAFECRLSNVNKLARFASLYADKVLVQDPFQVYLAPNKCEHLFTGEWSADLPIRMNVVGDLHVLYHLRPLIEAGIIGFATSELHFCPSCYERHFKLKVSRAEEILKQRYLRETEYILGYDSQLRKPLVINTGPEDLVKHGKVSWSIKLPQNLEDKFDPMQPYRLSENDLVESDILRDSVAPILRDIVTQNWYSHLYGTHYVTDREIDFDVLSAVNDLETNSHSKAFIEALSHSVPFLDNVELPKLIRLREEEGEAFKVYRDAVQHILKSVNSSDAKVIREAFDDVVRPELNKIDLVIKKSKKLLWDSLVREVIYDTGFISVGLFTGLLPPNICQLVAAMGGLKFISGALKKASKLLQEPVEIKDNKFYFLWKVRKKSQTGE